ncbi:MAG: hypothetical protein WBX25_04145 [Rhodomicrobium sp.]
MRIISSLAFALLALCSFGQACSAGDTPTIIILDATAQMSAKLGNERKIDAVKKAISAVPSYMPSESPVALWAFGTNPEKKCEGRRELVALKSASSAATAFGKALHPIEPKAARAPAFGTLTTALESIENVKNSPVSAVLIAGTGDDCIPDICTDAKRLHDLYPLAKLTVLGIGMSEPGVTGFTCAAKAMGGSFVAIKSGKELDHALRQALDTDPQTPKQNSGAAQPAATSSSNKKATADTSTQTATANPSSSKPADQDRKTQAEEKPPAPQPEPNAIISAVLAKDTPPLEAGVTWEVFKVTTTPTGQKRVAEAPSWTLGGGQARIRLPDGQYIARASYGSATASNEFSVGPTKAEPVIIVNAGTVAAEALQTPGGMPADDAFFILYRRNAQGGTEEVARSSEFPATFHVSAGEYVLSAYSGLAKLDTNVKVEAGKVSAVRIALNVGTLELKTLAAEGSLKLVPARQEIYAGAPEPGKSSPAFLRLEGSSHRIQLPAGTYRVVTNLGDAREESTVSVTAGQTTEKSIILNPGEAMITLPPKKPDQVCAVYEAGANRASGPAGRGAGAAISFTLKSGLYDVECHGKGTTASVKPSQIRVIAGEAQTLAIDE